MKRISIWTAIVISLAFLDLGLIGGYLLSSDSNIKLGDISSFFSATAAIITALIALNALNSWRKEHNYKRSLTIKNELAIELIRMKKLAIDYGIAEITARKKNTDSRIEKSSDNYEKMSFAQASLTESIEIWSITDKEVFKLNKREFNQEITISVFNVINEASEHTEAKAIYEVTNGVSAVFDIFIEKYCSHEM